MAKKEETEEERKLRKQKKKEKKDAKRKRESDISSDPPPGTRIKIKRLEEEHGDSIQRIVAPVMNQEAVTSYSVFQKKKISLMLSLLPSSMANMTKAYQASLQSMLLKYSDALEGVLLSYTNIKVDNVPNKGPYGRIMDELPHIHCYVTCDVLVFSPQVGHRLQGVVSESFPSHIGFLVFDLFNAMVSAESLRVCGFLFDPDLNQWSKDDSGMSIAESDIMEFTIEKLHECDGLISLQCKDPVTISII